MKKKKSKKLKVLGVCGGNGVILYPFRRNLIGNIEFRSAFKSKSNLQWYQNFKVPYVSDLTVGQYLFKEVDVIIGAPDCGHSSILTYTGGRGKLKDPNENESVRTFFSSIKQYQPKLWLMENLPGMMNTITMSDFKDNFPNYRFVFHNLSVSEFGNSQKTRKRLVVIGIQKDLPADVFMYMNDIYRVNEIKTVGELLEGLEEDDLEFGNVREDEEKEVKMGKTHYSFKAIAKEWNTKLKKEKYWPTGIVKMPYIPGVYRVKKNDFPQTCRKDPRQFRPDGKPLSPRELARFQGIPDKFKFFMNPEKVEHSINKARATVTKGAPYEIGLWFKNQLELCKPFL